MHTSLYRQVLQDKQDLYNRAVADGVVTPFIWPIDTFPVICLAIGVIYTPQLPKTFATVSRYVLTLASLCYMTWRWPYARTFGLTAGYGLGLTGFWGLIMTVILMILHDPGKDFRRIELRREMSSHMMDKASGLANRTAQNGELRKRVLPSQQPNDSTADKRARELSAGLKAVHYVWQERPLEFWHLVDWSVDLMTSFRGINWNIRIPIRSYAIPPPEGDPPTLPPETWKLRESAMKQLQRSSITNFVLYYLLLDLLKTFMMTDPYWLGIAPLKSPSTWPWLVRLTEVLPFATKLFRLGTSLVAVVAALTFIFSLNPLFFGTVLPHLIGEERLYSFTKAPLLEAWMYPPQWGNMFEILCDKGLAGMWSTWWHQMFRYGISEPARLLTRQLDINPRGQIGRIVQLLVAFGLTAGIHTAASSTTFSIIPGRPWHAFIFFASQAIGILVQTEASRLLNKLMRWPKIVRQAGNFGFVFIFLWYMGPFLSDDFARCQIWLFEPVPISIFRGLGLGPGDCWCPWLQVPEGGRWIGLWKGKHWYSSGIGIY